MKYIMTVLFLEFADHASVSSSSSYRSSLTMQRFQALKAINQNLLKTRKDSFDSYCSRYQLKDIEEVKDDIGSCPSTSDIERSLSQASSSGSLVADYHSCTSDQASTSDVGSHCSLSKSQVSFLDFAFNFTDA